MKILTTVIVLFLTLNAFAQTLVNNVSVSKRVLIFSKTAGYHHESIPAGIAAIQKLGRENHFEVDTTTNATLFTADNLKKYAAIIFLNTSGNVLDTVQKFNFQRYIEGGGGFAGIHCASSTEKAWTWYGHLVGAVFTNHPEPQTGVVVRMDSINAATKNLPPRWTWKDEWYNFRDIQNDLHILLTADESSYKGGTNGPFHPLAWYHEYDGGRSFYTALGHFPEAYSDPFYLRHILEGIQYAMGNNKANK